MKKIAYTTNTQLWQIERELKEKGYTKISDCYWSQIFTNGNDEIATIRD